MAIDSDPNHDVCERDGAHASQPPVASGRNRFRRYKIWLPVASVLLLLIVSETACRVFDLAPQRESGFRFLVRQQDNDVEHLYMTYDPKTLWAPVPNYRSSGARHAEVYINSMGFRDREYSLEKPPAVFRILCLGDSTTFGFFVSSRAAYQNVLEDKLNTSGDFGDVRFEVINAGVPGFSSFQCLNLLRHRGVQLSPDVVILLVSPNDVKKSKMRDEQIVAEAAPKAVVRANEILSYLASYRLLRSALVKTPPAVPAQPVARVGEEDCVGNILEMKSLCESTGTRFVLIAFPYLTPFPPDGPLELEADLASLRQAVYHAAEENSIPLVDLPKMREEYGDNYADFFIDLVHPSESGHQYMAEQIYEILLREDLLPKPQSITKDSGSS